ncbi:hypothetical protein MKX03_025418 [Papaver bracteatum]|nr:hypothetical protein MKX03_025418 [Papaver bracteatum]
MVKRKGAQKPQTPLPVDLRKKLLKIVHHHGQLKTSFHALKSQIKTGLLDAGDVFNSLSIPLMKLVGLKTEEMAEEGRSSTFFVESDSTQLNFQHQRNVFVSERQSKSSFPAEERDQFHQMEKLVLKEEENYSERVRKARNEVMEKQRVQLQKLVHLLRKIEIHVNTRQDDILETLNRHSHSIHNIFQKSASYITNVHRIARTNNDQCETTALIAMVLKLLRGIFEQMNSVTGSVEDGVKDLICELAEKMCKPMVDYVQEIKAEIATGGTLKKLLDVVGEMERLLALEEDQIVDESIRSLLKTALKNSNNKVQSKFPTSPWGTSELLKFVPAAPGKKTHEKLISRGNYQNKLSTAVVEPVVINQNLRRTTGSVTWTLRSQMGTPGNLSSDCWPSLGSSPSVLVNHCQQRKQNVQKQISSSKKTRVQTWK